MLGKTAEEAVQKVITDDMDALLNVLPPHIKAPLLKQPDLSELLEVVLDLGSFRKPAFPDVRKCSPKKR